MRSGARRAVGAALALVVVGGAAACSGGCSGPSCGRPTTATTTTTTTRWVDNWPTTTTTTYVAGGCAATSRVVATWPGYVQLAITVTAQRPISSWTAGFNVATGTTVEQAWSAQVSQNASRVTAVSYPWNGKLALGASTEFGVILKGSPGIVQPGCIGS